MASRNQFDETELRQLFVAGRESLIIKTFELKLQ
jgi:hypothetical protein